ncbi:MAG: FAD:protein FMN transferase [Gammaproteobacteria bacterium AqS3]|nr:FAD:protein FMN transferase [Gammaproteobacteria bacterium AqS3]
MSRRTRCAHRLLSCCAAGLLAGLVLAGCAPTQQRISGPTMGTSYSVQWHGGALGSEEVRRRIEAELVRINALASNWDADSAISRLERKAGSGWADVDAELAVLLDFAGLLHRQTGGVYDITLGPVIDLWGFGPGPVRFQPPDADALDAARALTGMHRIERRPGQALLPAGMRLNLSSIAKGYAVDRLAEALLDAGIRDFIAEIGGELRTSGRNASGAQWVLGVQNPGGGAVPMLRLTLPEGGAIATSGDYNNFFVYEERMYGHLLDGTTGAPVQHAASVTVIAGDCMSADGYATALAVLGPERARSLAEREGIAAVLVWRTGEGLLEPEITPAAEPYIL